MDGFHILFMCLIDAIDSEMVSLEVQLRQCWNDAVKMNTRCSSVEIRGFRPVVANVMSPFG